MISDKRPKATNVITDNSRFLETYTMLPIRYIFKDPIKKIGEFIRACDACAAKFSLSKNHRNLKNIFGVKICKYLPSTVHFKEPSPKRTFEIYL